MSNTSSYRDDPKETVRVFHPVLRALKVRNTTGHRPVSLAEFDQLEFLKLDAWSVQFAIGDIDATGIFLIKYTKQGLVRAYIILNKKLYAHHSKEMKEIRKIAAVHEFVHFIAMILVATAIGTESLRSTLFQRLQDKIDKLWGPNLLDLYLALSGKKTRSGVVPPELTDAHFRLGHEGQTSDYDILFLYFMFSRELFEEYFDMAMQTQFKELYSEPATRDAAIKLLLDTLTTAANDKDVPYDMAKNQLFEWVHVYMR